VAQSAFIGKKPEAVALERIRMESGAMQRIGGNH
jgi:hypothetical protein